MTSIESEICAQTACQVCGATLEHRSRGRQRRFCSDACRVQAHRERSSCNEIAAKAPTADSPSNANFVTKTSSKNNDLLRPKSALEKARLFWIKVNDVTWKATDGKMSRTPASHGQWAGYETEQALAWVIETGWPFGQSAWYARCGVRSYGPTSFAVAKQAAAAIVTGAHLPEDERARSFAGEIDLNTEQKVGKAAGKWLENIDLDDANALPALHADPRAVSETFRKYSTNARRRRNEGGANEHRSTRGKTVSSRRTALAQS